MRACFLLFLFCFAASANATTQFVLTKAYGGGVIGYYSKVSLTQAKTEIYGSAGASYNCFDETNYSLTTVLYNQPFRCNTGDVANPDAFLWKFAVIQDICPQPEYSSGPDTSKPPGQQCTKDCTSKNGSSAGTFRFKVADANAVTLAPIGAITQPPNPVCVAQCSASRTTGSKSGALNGAGTTGTIPIYTDQPYLFNGGSCTDPADTPVGFEPEMTTPQVTPPNPDWNGGGGTGDVGHSAGGGGGTGGTGTCGGAGQPACSTCGGAGQPVCTTCGGAGQPVCETPPTCGGTGQPACGTGGDGGGTGSCGGAGQPACGTGGTGGGGEAACGAPGQPPCVISGAGVPTGLDLGVKTEGIDSKMAEGNSTITGITSASMNMTNWFPQIPTAACTNPTVDFMGRSFAFAMCSYFNTIKDIVSACVAMLALFGCVTCVQRAIRA